MLGSLRIRGNGSPLKYDIQIKTYSKSQNYPNLFFQTGLVPAEQACINMGYFLCRIFDKLKFFTRHFQNTRHNRHIKAIIHDYTIALNYSLRRDDEEDGDDDEEDGDEDEEDGNEDTRNSPVRVH